MTAQVPTSHLDLVTGPRIGMLATVAKNSAPQVTAIWFIYEDGVVKTSLVKERQKYINMVSNPNATLFLIDSANPFRTLEIRGTATFSDDPNLQFFEKIVRAYGADPETFPAPKENRVNLTLTPRRVVSNG